MTHTSNPSTQESLDYDIEASAVRKYHYVACTYCGDTIERYFNRPGTCFKCRTKKQSERNKEKKSWRKTPQPFFDQPIYTRNRST